MGLVAIIVVIQTRPRKHHAHRLGYRPLRTFDRGAALLPDIKNAAGRALAILVHHDGSRVGFA